MMNSSDRHNLYTYSDPTLSLWQAAVAEVQGRHESVTNRMALATSNRLPATPVPAQNELMSPVYLLGEPLKAKRRCPMRSLPK